jgi:hypothetical protein
VDPFPISKIFYWFISSFIKNKSLWLGLGVRVRLGCVWLGLGLKFVN